MIRRVLLFGSVVGLMSLALLLFKFQIIGSNLSAVSLFFVFFLLLIFPGLLSLYILFDTQIPLGSVIPNSFVLSIAIWSVPGFYLLWTQSNIRVMEWWVIVILLTLTVLAILMFCIRVYRHPILLSKIRWSQPYHSFKEYPILYTLAFISILGTVYLFSFIQNLHPASDRISYQAFIRHFIDTERFLGQGLYISEDRIPVIGRHLTQVWLLCIGLVVKLASIELLDAYVYLLPPICMLISFFALYSLGKELTGTIRGALIIVCIQTIYIISDIDPIGDGIGFNFLFRVLEDKFLLIFILMPVNWWLILRYLKTNRVEYFLALSLVIVGIVTIHPMGIVLFSISIGLFAPLHLAANFSKKTFLKLVAIFGVIAFLVWIPLWQRQATAERISLQFEGVDTISESLTTLRLSRVLILSESPLNYISVPSLMSHPFEIVTLLLALFFIIYLAKGYTSQFIVSNTIGPILLCYTPFITPLLGKIITPWMIWRVLWLVPVAITIGCALEKGLCSLESKMFFGKRNPKVYTQIAIVGIIAIISGLLIQQIDYGLDRIRVRNQRAITVDELDALYFLRKSADQGSRIFAPESRIIDEIPTIVGHSYGLTFQSSPPFKDSSVSDMMRFYSASWPTSLHFELIEDYEIDYIIIYRNNELDYQFRLLPSAFHSVYTNEQISIYQPAESVNKIDAQIISGYSALTVGNYSSAESNFRMVLEEKPDNLLAILGIGRLNSRQNRPFEAKDFYELAYGLAPDNSWIANYLALNQVLRAEQLADRKVYADAIELYEHAIGLAPLNVEIQQHILDFLTYSQDLLPKNNLSDRLIALAQEGVQRNPYNQEVYMNLIQVYYRLGRYQNLNEVIDSLEKNISATPGFYFTLGEMYENDAQIDRAIAMYKEAVAHDPNYVNAYLRISALYSRNNKVEQAIETMREAVDHNPQNASAHLELGKIYMNHSSSRLLSD